MLRTLASKIKILGSGLQDLWGPNL